MPTRERSFSEGASQMGVFNSAGEGKWRGWVEGESTRLCLTRGISVSILQQSAVGSG